MDNNNKQISDVSKEEVAYQNEITKTAQVKVPDIEFDGKPDVPEKASDNDSSESKNIDNTITKAEEIPGNDGRGASADQSDSDIAGDAYSDVDNTHLTPLTFDGLPKRSSQGFSLPSYEREEQNKETGVPQVAEVPKNPKKGRLTINTRALPLESGTYELYKFKKNAMLIFNYYELDGYKYPRNGTAADVEALTTTFESHNFEVTVQNGLNKKDLMDKLHKFTAQDFTEYGCIAVAVLTHGSKNGLIRAKDKLFSELSIINRLQARGRPSLITKPRIVIIQACRGKKCTRPENVSKSAFQFEHDFDDELPPSYTLPAEADLLILHSSYEGKASARHPEKGSWFIQSLCRRINLFSKNLDFEAIVSQVKKDVAIHRIGEKFDKYTQRFELFKQMPVSTSTLTRQLFLKKKGDTSDDSSCCDSVIPSTTADLDSSETPVPGDYMWLSDCECFLDHFEYIKRCLEIFVKEEKNQSDQLANTFLGIANSLERDDSAKSELCKAICKHLKIRVETDPAYRYLYLSNY